MGTPKKNRRVEGDDKKRKRKMRKAFVHSSLIKKIDNIQKEEKKKKSIEVYSRSSTILPTFVSKTFKI
jgi:ribosomal protein S19